MRFPKRQIFSFQREGTGRRPSVWMILMGANIGVFVTQTLLEAFHMDDIVGSLMLSRQGIESHYYWQFITYMFLHANVWHLLANMLAFYFAAREVEAILGPRHLLGIYFGGGILGGIAQIAATTGETVGASAGVMAVLIAFTTIMPELELTLLLFFVIPIRMRAKYLGWGLVGFTLLCVFLPLFPGVANVAHLGGCVFGWCYVRQLGYGNPLAIQRIIFKRRQQAERMERMPPGQFVSEEIDPILDKISREGIHSLTRAERRILELGRDKIAKKTTRG